MVILHVSVVVNGSTDGQTMLGVIVTATAQGSNDSTTIGTFDVSSTLTYVAPCGVRCSTADPLHLHIAAFDQSDGVTSCRFKVESLSNTIQFVFNAKSMN